MVKGIKRRAAGLHQDAYAYRRHATSLETGRSAGWLADMFSVFKPRGYWVKLHVAEARERYRGKGVPTPSPALSSRLWPGELACQRA